MEHNEAIVPEPPQGPKDVTSRLLGVHLSVPRAAHDCPGIKLLGRTVRSLVFSTDLVVIRNCDADAVLAVYPFTCQPAITQALVSTAGRPVLTGVAGSTTSGARSVLLAMESETQGVSGVVLNYGAVPELVSSIAQAVDVPVVATITDWDDLAREKVGGRSPGAQRRSRRAHAAGGGGRARGTALHADHRHGGPHRGVGARHRGRRGRRHLVDPSLAAADREGAHGAGAGLGTHAVPGRAAGTGASPGSAPKKRAEVADRPGMCTSVRLIIG